MNLLLDTHALIWFSENDPKLSLTAKTAIESPENNRFVSLATLWEMAIKLNLGKLTLQIPLIQIIPALSINGFDLLAIEPDHILKIEILPRIHGDPFDRMLIAQALSNGLSIVSKEELFEEYGVKRIW
jgi:PIN domain nuclease of toxin-antitoxin system